MNIHGFEVTIECENDYYMSFTAEREKTCFIAGDIKWDGCSNWNFQTDNTMAHFCGLEDMMTLNALMVELYKIASETIPGWNAELAS